MWVVDNSCQRLACEDDLNLTVDSSLRRYAVKMLQTRHIVQLLSRKNFVVTTIDQDFYCDEADLLGWHDYLMDSIDASGS